MIILDDFRLLTPLDYIRPRQELRGQRAGNPDDNMTNVESSGSIGV
jgi:hypothetical protein